MLSELRRISAECGRDPMITQGAGGNTSIKDGQQLIIKASGTHLRKALEQDIFIAIDLPELRAAIAKGREYDFNANLTQTGRGSIETPLHAAIDQRVVIHVHSVRALSFALRIDGLKDLERLLSGLSWTWVPYAKPGWPLTWELLRVSAPETNVWILQNHGVIVAADSCDEALALLWEVERRLDSGSVQSADLDQQSLAHLEEVVRGSCWRVPNGIEAHLLASQQGSRELIGAGVVCPDQAVFLGSNIPIVDNFKAIPQRASSKALLVRDRGVLVDAASGTGAEDVLTCLGLVAARLEPSARVSYLSPSAVSELISWDAEKYRQLLDNTSK